MTGTLAEELGHLKNHVEYPADRAHVIPTCNKMLHSSGMKCTDTAGMSVE